ncbi:N-formylglutamate amidohydrolase [Rhodococcus sp. IEGM 1409]|uniref:N-formylglutamate amidohydrolase n=1 Tax=Rhodococcus sp. IEGM 1409 TaxID=3047082 RepID=UPI0024B78E4A|nr:N-formylglutamate amidohydrolase [Rhodococcus sp. IEGM 1409]MDI9899621.1 N-formylglutamate amidohydrolase [Rhodococcus sp. IEGM 1409]
MFAPKDLTFYADRDSRSLDDAIAEADLLVSCPHSGSAIPAELSRFLAPEFTQRLQFDFTDMSTSPIVRRWAEIDLRIVYVENSRPRMIRDPNRAKPENPEASLREAFARVHKAGAGNKADLTRVDAGWNSLAETFTETAEHGLGVYERTRDALIETMVEKSFQLGRPFTTLSFHDTMNHTTGRDGAVNIERPEAD